MSVHLFGIRHHGPGSARAVKGALEALSPDVVLIEGPPDAQDAIKYVASEEMKPPVALLVYAVDEPKRAAFYPFAMYSPEWVAMKYALSAGEKGSGGIPVRFIDLPVAVRFAQDKEHEETLKKQLEEEQAKAAAASEAEGNAPEGEDEDESEEPGDATAEETPQPVDAVDSDNLTPRNEDKPITDGEVLAHDPFLAIARIAGYTDTELWWDHTFERRQDSTDVFDAVLELVTELRKHAPERNPREHARNEMREATMRQHIRAAQKEGFQRIAVVCGAWHAPALATMPPAKADNELLKGLPKLKTAASWIPWTYEHLASPFYGAGIEAPGWYHFLWKASESKAPVASMMAGWMIRAARAFRKEGFEISSAHAIEATRLAESLAAMRNSPMPGLPEIQESIRAVYCYGQDLPMAIVRNKLLISNRLGDVPDDVPRLPLLEDLSRKQKSLRLKPEADTKELDLDLRKENDMLRSCLLRQLNILDVDWGKVKSNSGKTSTFHEYWTLKWKPEFSLDLATSGIYGNTIEDAAIGKLQAEALKEQELVKLAGYLFAALTARLDAGIEPLLARVQEVAATTTDVSFLMKSLYPLARSFRYGDVRKTKAVAVESIYDGMVERICVGFPPACSSLNDDAATEMMGYMGSVAQALELVNSEAHNKVWFNALRIVSEREGLHGLVAGRSLRMLFDQNMITTEELGRRLGLAISIASGPIQAAQWVEGFLSKSGLLLIHHPELLRILYAWVATLNTDNFTALLPLLRRTFSAFATSERRQIAEKVHTLAQSRGSLVGLAELASGDGAGSPELDRDRVGLVLPILARMLGLKPPALSSSPTAVSAHDAAAV